MFYKRQIFIFYSELNEYSLQKLSTTKHLEKQTFWSKWIFFFFFFFAKSKAQVFYAILIKNPSCLFCGNQQTSLGIHMEMQSTANGQNNLENKTNVVPNFKTYYNATAINTMWYWHKDRHVEKQNRTRV